jgi:hypothetical protein
MSAGQTAGFLCCCGHPAIHHEGGTCLSDGRARTYCDCRGFHFREDKSHAFSHRETDDVVLNRVDNMVLNYLHGTDADGNPKTIPFAGTWISSAEADRISKDGP